MTLSLISVLSQDVTALWLLLKTSAGVWAPWASALVCCKRQGVGWAVYDNTLGELGGLALMPGSYCWLKRQGAMGVGCAWLARL